MVANSGQTLEHIVSAVKRVSDIIAEIAAGSQEQSTGIEQVNKAVMQLDDMTQQNAALVEQATAASKAMADQSQGLNDLMSRFDVGVASPAAAAAQRVAAPAAPRPKLRQTPQAGAKPAPQAAAAVRAKVAVGSDTAWEQF